MGDLQDFEEMHYGMAMLEWEKDRRGKQVQCPICLEWSPLKGETKQSECYLCKTCGSFRVRKEIIC